MLGRSEEYPRPFALFASDQKMALLLAVEAGADFDTIHALAMPFRPYIPQSVARALAERGEAMRSVRVDIFMGRLELGGW